jgi:tRNA 2-selenouridine synthase
MLQTGTVNWTSTTPRRLYNGAMHEFKSYDLIIDARSPREYQEDHIPGAVNLPVVDNDEYAEVGTLHRTDPMAAYQIGVVYSLNNIARHLRERFSGFDRKTRILVYCFRGGKRSRLWFDALDTIGYRVERLHGGWKGYRRRVNEQLASAPAGLRYVVLSGPSGCGKTRLLAALEQEGAQVLDLEGLAVHRGSVIGAVPGREQPSQKWFDSLLLHRLNGFDPGRPVWVEAESKTIGKVRLPDALMSAMQRGATLRVEAEMAQRVLLWREDFGHFERDPKSLIDRLSFLKPLIGGEEFGEWLRLAEQGEVVQLFERLMRNHYDPTYRRSLLRHYPEIDSAPLVRLEDLSEQGLRPVATRLRAQFE